MVKYGTYPPEVIRALLDFLKKKPLQQEKLRLLEQWELVKDGKLTQEARKLFSFVSDEDGEASAVST